MKLLANSESSFNEAVKTLRTTYNEKKYVRISYTTGRDRSVDQNALWFACYQRISETLGDGSVEDIQYWRSYCKLRCGVPILQVYSEEFRTRWFTLVLSNPLLQSWLAQINLMSDKMFGQDGFPVTRLFTTKQGAEYTESIVRLFTPRGVFFDDLLSD